MHSEPTYNCRVCGLKQTEPQYGIDGISPSFDYCDCCGVEFGYGDTTPKAAKLNREKWLNTGAIWRDPSKKPDGWDVEVQLAQVPTDFK